MIVKKLMLVAAIIVAVVVACVFYWYIDYRRNLTPKLILAIEVDDVKRICPEFEQWERNANPWECVPRDLTCRICSLSKLQCDHVIATYRKKIVGFSPYSFNATKGEVKIEPCTDNVIFIYSYSARYAPNYDGP